MADGAPEPTFPTRLNCTLLVGAVNPVVKSRTLAGGSPGG
jgi:hypothetical protein